MRCLKIALLFALMISAAAVAADVPMTSQQWIRDHVAGYEEPFTLVVGGEPLRICVALVQFYRNRDYAPAWTEGRTALSRASQLLHALKESPREGLNPADYSVDRVEKSLDKVLHTTDGADPVAMAELDVLLSQVFLRYAAHLGGWHFERLGTVDPEWVVQRPSFDFSGVLAQAIASDRVEETLLGLLPTQPYYVRLREALARYRAIAASGGWPQLSARSTEGDWRKRLVMEGFLSSTEESVPINQAIVAFQGAHGQRVDGTRSAAVLADLNVPVEERIQQIEVNLERWRWLPRDLGQRHIVVNVAGYDLKVIENGHPVADMTMPVVVGTPKPSRRTPEFSADLKYLVINPNWDVPVKIASKEILPALRRDPTYLARHNMEVRYHGGRVDPAGIDWSHVDGGHFPYALRQRPGHKNPLGTVKFPLPHTAPFDNLYLHGTSQPWLFKSTERVFSHGCIRIQDPIKLMAYLLAPDESWKKAMNVPNRQMLLANPIQVYVLYWTAWVDEQGTVQFRKDVYGRNTLLQETLVPSVHFADGVKPSNQQQSADALPSVVKVRHKAHKAHKIHRVPKVVQTPAPQDENANPGMTPIPKSGDDAPVITPAPESSGL